VRAPHLLVAVLLVHAAAFGISTAQRGVPASDFVRYYEIGSSAGRPYVDYQVEHPIGTLLLFKALARLPGGRPAFGLGVVVLNLIADAVIVGSLWWGWGVPAAVAGAAMLMPVLGLFFNRVDAWPTAAAILAVAAWRKDRPLMLGAALAVGAAFKLWPLVLATLLIAPWRGRRSMLALAAFGSVAAALGGLALWIAGGNSITQVLTFRGATGWQVESLAGSLVHLVDTHSVRLESGAFRVGTINHLVSTAMFLAAAPICIWASWRGAQLDRIGAGWLASVTALLLLSALLSAQYVIWLVPAAAIAWAEGDATLGVLTAIAILLTQLLWMFYGDVLDSHLAAMLLVVLRNVVLVALAAGALSRLRHGSPKGLRDAPSGASRRAGL
jgi:Glycosyltransferase family 87